ncbi:MAG: EamA/RhaT family transporter [Verrucomicrobiia bacterium]
MNLLPTEGLPFHLILPLLSSVVYVAGALALKRAADLGADVWRTARVCNFTAALVFAPLVFLGGTIPSWQLAWQPAVVALLFIAGQILNLLALNLGDVSVATPVLGVKVLLVALLTAVLLGQQMGPALWTAALLSSVAVALLNASGRHPHHRLGITIVLAVSAAISYALFDVLVQKWSSEWGVGRFLPIMIAFVALFTLGIRPSRNPKTRDPVALAAQRRWLAGGALGLALQSILFVVAIAVYGQATVANILYSSRGLWSVVAVWLVGAWFHNRERHLGRRVLAWRFVGAALLMSAIVIVLTKPS